jgi:hypothetical protein
MPFKKVGENDYTSPTGRHFNQKQVNLYYANGGHFPGEAHAAGGTVKGPSMARSKSYGTFGAAYAAGGPVLGRTRDFLKEQVEFRDPDEGGNRSYGANVSDAADEDNKYAKSGEGSGKGIKAPPPNTTKNKSLKAVKPRG